MSVDYTEWAVTARKAFRCTGYRCQSTIRKGETYVRAVAFPNHDANGGTRPWVMRLCCGCPTEYGRPMPAARRSQHD